MPSSLARSLVAVEPPSAPPQRPVVEEHFGEDIADSYRSLESLDDPEVVAWLAAQSQLAHTTFAALAGRRALLERIAELEQDSPGNVSQIALLPQGEVCYLKRAAGEEVAKLRCRQPGSPTEQLLIDPDTFPRTNPADHVTIECYAVSPDGHYVLFGLAAAGSEETRLHILDRQSGQLLPDTIPRVDTVYARPCWLDDGRAFTYSQRLPREEFVNDAECQSFTQARLHWIGGNPGDDPFVFGSQAAGSPLLEPLDFPAIVLTPGSRWAIGQVHHGDETDLTLYVTRVESLGKPAATWTRICSRADMVTRFGVRGEEIHLLTAAHAPCHRVVRTRLDAPDLATATTVFASESVVVDELAIAADAIYVGITDRAKRGIVRVPHDESLQATRLPLPDDEPSACVVAARVDMPGIILRTASWICEGRILCFDPKTQGLVDTDLLPAGRHGRPAGLVAWEVMVPSHDGVEVPLSIVCRQGLVLDGTAATLLLGYGAYGVTSPMSFSVPRLAWLERGGVIAVAHVRGGGTFGRAWHHAGRKATKPNSWKDFIACAEHLVREGYTSPRRLCVSGRSAGGILVGRAVTDRPDLFAAVSIAVGCTDMIRFETTANGPPNIPEFGTVTKEVEFHGLLAMSTLHQIRDGVSYPGIVLTHGINDPRVAPWQSAKTAARFQAANGGPRPVLLRIDYHSGHGSDVTRRQAREDLADVWSFFLWQCGDPEFQPE